MGNHPAPCPVQHCWRNPVGLAILGLGAAAAALTASLPLLRPWSGHAGGIFLLALIAYAGTAVVYALTPVETPEVRQLRRLRDAMAARLAGSAGDAPGLTSTMADAVERLDRVLIPVVARLTARSEALRRDLARFRRGELVAPDRCSLERLETVEARQREAIVATMQRAANAYGSILAMAQGTEFGSSAVAEAERWSRTLQEMQDALAELLDESARWDRRLEERTGGQLVPGGPPAGASGPEDADRADSRDGASP